MKKLHKYLLEQVDNSPLIFFRIIFGLLICLEAWGAIATGWVKKAFITPNYTFPFIDFDWLQPLQGDGMYYYYVVMGTFGFMVMLGWRYRFSMTMYAIMWAGVYLMQKTHYNNHYYLLMLLNFLMIVVPAHRYYSLDVKRDPSLKSNICPRWCLFIFAITMSIIYFYASVAKMNLDWIQGKPISIMFDGKSHFWLIGPLLAQTWFKFTVAWLGIGFDFFLGTALLWKKTRKYAFVGSVVFHLFNSAVFHVGIFPYLGIAIGVFYFDSEVIRALFFKSKPALISDNHVNVDYRSIWKTYLICFLLSLHILLPLRHWLYPGNVHFTEEGHRLSWHMMLRVKTGYVNLKVTDNDTGKEWVINPKSYLTTKQSGAVAKKPDMLWQFVQIVIDDLAQKGHSNISIYADGMVSLNGSKLKRLYNPDYDLASLEWSRFKHADWLMHD